MDDIYEQASDDFPLVENPSTSSDQHRYPRTEMAAKVLLSLGEGKPRNRLPEGGDGAALLGAAGRREGDNPDVGFIPNDPEAIGRARRETSIDRDRQDDIGGGDCGGGSQHNQLDRMQRMLDDLRDFTRQQQHQQRPMQTHFDQPQQRFNTRPRVMPDHFDGTGSWSDFISHFRTVAVINDWTEQDKAQFLAVSLRGEACQMLRFLPAETRRNFRRLQQALENHYEPSDRTEMYMIKLRNRKRTDKETIFQLSQSIKQLTIQAYPEATGKIFEDLCRGHFLQALDDGEFKKRVFDANTVSFDEMVSTASRMEAFDQTEFPKKKFVREINMRGKPDYKSTMPAERSDTGKCDMSDLNKQLEMLRREVEQLKMKNKAPFKKDYTCWHCGKEGHVRTRCPELYPNQSN